VSRSGFYAWRRRPRSERDRQSTILVDRIRAVHRESRGIYGSRAVYRACAARVRHRQSIASPGLMQRRACEAAQLDGSDSSPPAARPTCPPRRTGSPATSPPRPPTTSGSRTSLQVRTREGWLFLAILLDASRGGLWGGLPPRPRAGRRVEALHGAVARRRPAAGLVHHSDRGGSYASANYQELLDQHGMVCSMSRPGNCLDNGTGGELLPFLEDRVALSLHLYSRAQARSRVFEYIEGFYNRTRLHSALGYRSPEQYEKTGRHLTPCPLFRGNISSAASAS